MVLEPAWVKVNGRKFALVEYQDKKGELRPCYQLTKKAGAEELAKTAPRSARGGW